MGFGATFYLRLIIEVEVGLQTHQPETHEYSNESTGVISGVFRSWSGGCVATRKSDSLLIGSLL